MFGQRWSETKCVDRSRAGSIQKDKA
jgi:hypothetical protein